MNRIKLLLMCLLTLCAFGCSAGPIEDVGEQQDALTTCSKPTGGAGDVTLPFDRFVYAVHSHPTQPWKMVVEEKIIATGIVVSREMDFGGVDAVNSQASIAGPGWTSTSNSKLLQFNILAADAWTNGQYPGCPNDGNYVCAIGVASNAPSTSFFMFTFNKNYSAPTISYNQFYSGLYGFFGMGATLPQKVGFTYSTLSGAVTTKKLLFSGPKLDACLYP